TDIMGEIAAASQEQTRGIEQVNQAITQMDQVTQQNAALVEEASAAAQAMREQADHLVAAVSVFKLSELRQQPPVGPDHGAASARRNQHMQAEQAATFSRAGATRTPAHRPAPVADPVET
ncbi:MAG TPA: methyl-accepting chemotaxis protein, partial [Ramlibacter sp.]|nr:methyl-accepting chemotaxis protein [Ramlibacter sp.]